jgi:hypothetical protein
MACTGDSGAAGPGGVCREETAHVVQDGTNRASSQPQGATLGSGTNGKTKLGLKADARPGFRIAAVMVGMKCEHVVSLVTFRGQA